MRSFRAARARRQLTEGRPLRDPARKKVRTPVPLSPTVQDKGSGVGFKSLPRAQDDLSGEYSTICKNGWHKSMRHAPVYDWRLAYATPCGQVGVTRQPWEHFAMCFTIRSRQNPGPIGQILLPRLSIGALWVRHKADLYFGNMHAPFKSACCRWN